MNAIARFFVAAMMAVLLSVPESARAGDHAGAAGFVGGGAPRPRAICGAWGCYSYNKRLSRRTRGFRRFLGYLNWASHTWPYYGYGGWGWGGGFYGGYGYGGGYYGPYWPGDYRNAYAGLFGNYRFPPVY